MPKKPTSSERIDLIRTAQESRNPMDAQAMAASLACLEAGAPFRSEN